MATTNGFQAVALQKFVTRWPESMTRSNVSSANGGLAVFILGGLKWPHERHLMPSAKRPRRASAAKQFAATERIPEHAIA